MNNDKPRAFVFVNGIINWPGAHDGWTDRAVTWTNCCSPHKAEKWEYAAGAITRRLLQQDRAIKIATMMRYYEAAGFDVVLVGHSNGGDIIARVLALRNGEPWYFQHQVRSAHLFAPAADAADFRRALKDGDLARLFIYGSANDRALQLAGVSRTLFGWAGLGYGTLGLAPEPFADLPNVIVTRRDDYGHSDWFNKGDNFESTMLALHRNDRNSPDQQK